MTTHSLYRFFDAAGDLLYVGRTTDARARWRSHERAKEWFDEVATITRVFLPDADDLATAEREAIETESPRYNIALRLVAPVINGGFCDVGQRLFGLADAAAYINVRLDEMRRLVDANTFPVVRLDSTPRFDRADLDAYADRKKAAST